MTRLADALICLLIGFLLGTCLGIWLVRDDWARSWKACADALKHESLMVQAVVCSQTQRR